MPLNIGRQNPQQYEIVEGLQPGDWVITTGYDTFGDKYCRRDFFGKPESALLMEDFAKNFW